MRDHIGTPSRCFATSALILLGSSINGDKLAHYRGLDLPAKHCVRAPAAPVWISHKSGMPTLCPSGFRLVNTTAFLAS
jgi:hypothetical protein